ncbi:hypothetical protein [Bacillus sp. J33]|uniref:hypothetical protein n=1 Tax=Bacillus sp. J33 TaxID=935836 RepID=UPI00047CFAD1|nr:hypothetical protein [Bacillus sp. J33]
MKGTAILYHDENKVTIIENVEHSVFEELKEQCGDKHCQCHLENKVIDFGAVSPVFWHEDEVDWDYGY